ncbi:uncharacterized protein DUF4397 [Tumebacillus sp. BK434]|uniref:DUF4397 domain-containing protein n=1 Tax=Tumebacillus sp. BK434 TaxID=2512169 RepID=UPI0010DCA49F|nr:DUF4397 domain-containing protein [Tumebacillus sp. BK434]TCP55714.1 uncharacterized protein DUF4397 [Tumebacillus sp. BK434]
MNREERQLVAFEQLAREVEKLVDLVQESQQNQYDFMQEACRLLQEQHQDVNSLVERENTQDQLKGMLDEVLKQMNVQFANQMGAPAGMGAGDVDMLAGQSGTMPMPAAGPGQTPVQPGYLSPQATSGWGQQVQPTVPFQPGVLPETSHTYTPGETFPFPLSGSVPVQQDGMGQAVGLMTDSAYEAVENVPQEGVITDIGLLPDAGTAVLPISELVEPEAIPVVKPVGQPATGARIRFFHASPDTPGVDIYIDGKKAAEDVDFEGISDYFPLTPGRHRVQVFRYGKQVGALIDTTFNAKPNQSYTVAIGGSFKDVRPIMIEDEPKKARPGFSRVKIVHLSPNAPAVDVTLPSGKVLISHLTFKEKSPYLQVTPGRRDLELRLAGKKDVLLRLPKMRFDPDVTYTLYVVGLAGGQPPLASELIPEG